MNEDEIYGALLDCARALQKGATEERRWKALDRARKAIWQIESERRARDLALQEWELTK